MKYHLTRVLAGLTAALLAVPIPSAAAEAEQVTLNPPADVADFTPIGSLFLSLDSNMNGSTIDVHLISPEGDLLYYHYPVFVFGSTKITCPLMRDGNYRVTVNSPQEDSAKYRTDTMIVQVQDPDPADRVPEFDRTEHTVYFTVKPSPDGSVSTSTDPALKDRTYVSETHYSYARKLYSAGDVTEDNIVNAKDATAILRAAAAIGVNSDTGLTSLRLAEADFNGDGKINAKDATLVLNYSTAFAVGNFTGTPLEFVRSQQQ
ncbi:MAG: hypothetical protein K6F80_07700 [Oscillospiraceae bacterium]|nr:hypothetical protein [Oscillospiraceae bacterium]